MIKFCNLFSGSSGNCTYVSSATTNILIDAGVSCQRISKALEEIGSSISEIDAILITHEHIDHTKGLTTISKKYNIPIYASEKTWDKLDCLKVPKCDMEFFTVGEAFALGDFELFPFHIPHDAIDPCGFNILCNNKKITIATDIGHITDSTLELMENSDILMLEANYDLETLKAGSYPFFLKERILSDNGHLSNEMASKAISYLCKKGVNNFVLGHLSKENNFPELAYQTVVNELRMNDIPCDLFNLSIANRDTVDNVLELI
jgi:phosphoribosyl 1,2-cyclic phosphodiesterase